MTRPPPYILHKVRGSQGRADGEYYSWTVAVYETREEAEAELRRVRQELRIFNAEFDRLLAVEAATGVDQHRRVRTLLNRTLPHDPDALAHRMSTDRKYVLELEYVYSSHAARLEERAALDDQAEEKGWKR